MSGKMYTATDIAKKLGYQRHTVNYYIKKWGISPTTCIGGSNVYGENIVEIMKKMLGQLQDVKVFTIENKRVKNKTSEHEKSEPRGK